jgi:putative oxidoreductase
MPPFFGTIIQTEEDHVVLFLRVIAGVIIFPYGMQKLLGWYDGPGIAGSLQQLHARKLPSFIAWLIIVGQSFGSIALIIGCLGRFAAAGNIIIFTAAMFTHVQDGWMMNWFNKKKGEGIEYFVMLLALLLVILVKGSGAWSVDIWLWHVFYA